MKLKWKFTEAKNGLSKVLDQATERPQEIMRRKQRFVIVTAEDFESMEPGGVGKWFDRMDAEEAARTFLKKS